MTFGMTPTLLPVACLSPVKVRPGRLRSGFLLRWMLLGVLCIGPIARAEVSDAQRSSTQEIDPASGSARFYVDSISEENRGQLARAKQSLETALSVAQSEKNPRAQAIVLERLALLLEKSGQSINARSRWETACELRAKAKDELGELVCLEQLGPRYIAAQNSARAQKSYERLRKLARKFEDKTVEAETFLGTGRAAVIAHSAGPARRDLEKALEQFQALAMPSKIAEVYYAQAELARGQEDFAGAYALSNKALELDASNTRFALSLLQDTLLLGRYDEVQGRISRLPVSELKPVQKVEMQMVSLVMFAASGNQQGVERSARTLMDAFVSVPASDEGVPATSSVRRFLKQDTRMAPALKETLGGIVVVLSAPHTSVSELALKKQLEVLVDQARAGSAK